MSHPALYRYIYKCTLLIRPCHIGLHLQANMHIYTGRELSSATVVFLSLQISLIWSFQMLNEFNEAFVFWQLETYRQSDYSCVPIQASYQQAWRDHRWSAADGWWWFSSRPLWWPRVLPVAVCWCWYRQSSGLDPVACRKLPLDRR